MTRGNPIYLDGQGCKHHGAEVSEVSMIHVGGEPRDGAGRSCD